MPCPLAIRRQWLRSSAVPWNSRGYQARGTEIIRPSESSTDRVSSVASTDNAVAVLGSTVEEFMPALQQLLLVLFDKSLEGCSSPAARSRDCAPAGRDQARTW